jgi:hypothetical protein
VFTESDPLLAAAQRENEIASGIRTAHAAEKYAQRQRERRRARRARFEISDVDVERMVTDFIAVHGGIVRCPPAYAVPSSQYRS